MGSGRCERLERTTMGGGGSGYWVVMGTMLMGSEGVVGSRMSSSDGDEASCYTIKLEKEWEGI